MNTSDQFRVAFLTDIHGNAAALDAVLADVKPRRPNRIVFGGDLCLNGPRPREVLERVRELGAPSVLGNTDSMVLETVDPVCAWTAQQIGEEGLAYLRTLPLQWRVTPPGGIELDEDLLLVHSSPRSNEDMLLFFIQETGTNFTHLTTPEEAEDMFNGVRAAMTLYGHIHYPSAGQVNGIPVRSVGSVGFPFDGSPRPAYAIASWDGAGWSVENYRVDYDYESAARDCENSTLPWKERSAAMIRRAIWLPRE